MLKFKPLTIEDKEIFDKYLKEYKFSTCEYSFANLIIWRKGCELEYTIFEDTLIIKKKDFKEDYHFMQPIGYKKNNLKNIIEELKEYKLSHRMQFLFKDIEEPFLADLKEIYGEEAEIEEDEDNFDYIYLREKLATLSGKKLHGKKNHYNYFIKTYDYEVKDLKELGVVEDCIYAAQLWYDRRESPYKYLDYELEGIKEIIGNLDKLNLKGIAVYVDGKISAFTIGERVNDDMAIIHIEKGLADIRGIYAFTNKTFAEQYLKDVEYINREQDLGIEGLRKAKKSYYPFKLEKKYNINI